MECGSAFGESLTACNDHVGRYHVFVIPDTEILTKVALVLENSICLELARGRPLDDP